MTATINDAPAGESFAGLVEKVRALPLSDAHKAAAIARLMGG